MTVAEASRFEISPASHLTTAPSVSCVPRQRIARTLQHWGDDGGLCSLCSRMLLLLLLRGGFSPEDLGCPVGSTENWGGNKGASWKSDPARTELIAAHPWLCLRNSFSVTSDSSPALLQKKIREETWNPGIIIIGGFFKRKPMLHFDRSQNLQGKNPNFGAACLQ